jgi:hypothetical protein
VRLKRSTSTQLAAGSWNDGDVLWDAYLLYRADARWDFEKLFGAPK